MEASTQLEHDGNSLRGSTHARGEVLPGPTIVVSNRASHKPRSFKKTNASRLGRRARLIIGIMLAWTFLYPSVHYYLGQVEFISGSFGVSWAGLIDFGMFLMSFLAFVGCLLSRSTPRVFMLWPTLFYFVAVLYSIVLSPVAATAARSSIVGLVPLLFFLSITMLSKRVDLSDTIARTVVLSSLFPIAIATFQVLSNTVPAFRDVASALPADPYSLEPYPGLGIPRASGTMFTYNPFAVFIGIVFLCVLLRYERRLGRVSRWLVLFACGTMIVAAFMRSVWLALVVALGFASWMMTAKTRVTTVVIAGAAGLLVIVTPLGGLIADRFSDSSSLADRGKLIDFGKDLFVVQPWGYGAGMSRVLTYQLDMGQTFVLRGDYEAGVAFHNDYMTAAIEGGILLVGAYVFLQINLLILALRVVKLSKRLRVSPNRGIWLGTVTLMLAIVALTDSGLVAYGSFTFWLLAAGVEMEYRNLVSIARQRSVSSSVER